MVDTKTDDARFGDKSEQPRPNEAKPAAPHDAERATSGESESQEPEGRPGANDAFRSDDRKTAR